jgi:hypothetical protein
MINGGAVVAKESTVTLTLADGDSGATQMRFSDDDTTWTEWEAYSVTREYTLPVGDGAKTVYVQLKDAAGNGSAAINATITLDMTVPSGTVTINGGAAVTNAMSVTLVISDEGSGAMQMRFSDDNTTWTEWESFGETREYTLHVGDGAKTVYVQLKDAADNESAAISATITLDTTAPSGTVTINGGSAYTKERIVTLSLADGDSGAAQMRFSDNSTAWTEWEAYSETREYTLPGDEGPKTVYVQLKDAAGNESVAISATITLDTAAPSGILTVNGGAVVTKESTVTLTFADGDSGAIQMRFSGDGTAWTEWEAYSATKTYTLSGGDGAKTVHVQLKDAAGNESTAISATITLDTTAPSGTVTINGGSAYTKERIVTLSLADGDSGAAQMRFSDDNTTWTEWEAYSVTREYTLPVGDGPKTVYVQLKDAAGNESVAINATITLDTASPSGTVTINGGAAVTNAVSVTLAISEEGSGAAQMRFSDDNTMWAEWETYSATKEYTLPGDDGAKTVYVQLKDAAGNESTAISASITLDMTAPSGTVMINGGAAVTNAVSVTLAISDEGSVAAQMRFSDDNTTWTEWEAYSVKREYTLPVGDGAKTVYVQLQDAAGNESAAISATITLDTTVPSGTVTINGGSAYTKERTVTLTLIDGNSGAAQMRFSDDNTAWTEWETYSATKTYTLPVGDGPKTVYVQLQDAAGNESVAISATITLDTSALSGTVTINGGSAFTKERIVTLVLADGDSGAAQVRFSDDNTTWTEWETYNATKSYTLPGDDGAKTVYVQLQDAAGNESVAISATITLDTSAPSGIMKVNGGAVVTRESAVTLTFADVDGGATQMRFSDDNTAWTEWEAYSATKTYTLPGDDGAKTVYVQLQDAAGNESAAISATITLDTTVPSGTVTINSGAAVTKESTVTLTLKHEDSGAAQMRFSDDSTTWTDWEAYSETRVYTLPVGEGPKTVYVQLKDAAGNESVAISATITLDTTAPCGTVTINGGTAYTKERNVTLSFAGGDSGAAQMRFSVDATTWSDWEAYSETRVYTLPVGEGPKTVYVQLKDAAGNESVAISATITLDTTLPSGTVVISGGAALTKATTVTLTVYDGGSDATHMRFSDDSSIWSEWESFSASATKTYTLSGGDGLKTVYVQVKDAAGNESNLFSSTITLDTTPPSGEAAINGGAKVTSEATVNINLTDGDTEAAQMRFSSDNIIWTEWEAYKMTKAYTLPGRDEDVKNFV